MTQRFVSGAVLAVFFGALSALAGAQELAHPGIRYIRIPMNYPPRVVIVEGVPLVHTRQILPLDHKGKIVGEGSAVRQSQQILDNLLAVLKESGSGIHRLVRVNIYALSNTTVNRFRQCLSERDPGSLPAITSVLTPLPNRKALVAVDAVAAADDPGKTVEFIRCPSVAGHDGCADAAVLPRGGVAYLSGQPDEGGLDSSAVARSMSGLMKTMRHLKLSPKDVVQVKVFLRPMTSADDVLTELRKYFPNQSLPPVVFVEWLAAVPLEIEMIAQLPPSGNSELSGKPVEDVVYYTPPEVRPSNTFSKAALMRGDRQIYISGLYARVPSRGEPQAVYLFDQLQEVLKKSGSDIRHLVKATYYVSDDDAARWVDRLRPRVYDPLRPPAASKVMVHGVGMAQRTMTVDMIAVPTGP